MLDARLPVSVHHPLKSGLGVILVLPIGTMEQLVFCSAPAAASLSPARVGPLRLQPRHKASQIATANGEVRRADHDAAALHAINVGQGNGVGAVNAVKAHA